jgi:hypothetical protein
MRFVRSHSVKNVMPAVLVCRLLTRPPELERRLSTLGLDHACVCIANGKTPCASRSLLYTARWLQSDNDTFFPCSCSRNMSNNQPEGLSALLSPLDYTCSSKGMNTNKHVRV